MRISASRALACLLAASALSAPAAAQLPFTTVPAPAVPGALAGSGQAVTGIVGFGDSYADIGNLFKITGQLPPPVPYPTGRFSGGTNFVDSLAATYGVAQTNFAIGGAQAGPTNVVAPGIAGFQQEWQSFVAAGRGFTAGDVLALSIGGNDARAYRLSGGTAAGVDAASTVVANQAIAGINALVGRGARTIVFTAGDVGQLPEAIGQANAAIGSAFSQAYNAKASAALSGLAAGGVRVAYVDLSAIGDTVRANPQAFGFTNVVNSCPVPACVVDPVLQSQYFFYVDGVHLTSAAFALVSRYAVAQLAAPYSFRANLDLPQRATQAFGRTLTGRLDLARNRAADSGQGIGLFASFTGFRGDREAGAFNDAADHEGVGGMAGVDYGVGASTFGAAFNYSKGRSDGFNGNRVRSDSYQLGGYAGFSSGSLFVQGYGSYSWHKLNIRREAVLTPSTASPDATSWGAGLHAGYLFASGALLIGPVIGADYARTRLDGYTEAGDGAATLTVSRQRVRAITGSAGGEARYAVAEGVVPFVRVTAEKAIDGGGRIVRYAATSAPTIVNGFAIPRESRDLHGAVAGGVRAEIMPGVALDLSAKADFARDEGDDASLFAGVRVAF